MKLASILALALLSAATCIARSQEPVLPPDTSTAATAHVDVNWAPPALEQLTHQAAVKSNFTLDRAMLGVAAGLVPDSEADVRRAVRKLDGLSVHLLRFGSAAALDEAQVDAVRAAYHQHGWKHLVTTSSAGGPVRNSTTDVWLVLDGADMHGAVVLVESASSLVLVSLSGNISPEDLLHLRGHFGIPKFSSDRLDAPLVQ
ncbi:MAG: DUF4252 domain-containing protein [Terracidiphilus sp.]|nr:DUF4252 domain-containing protein [Terracidiphilus sp.]